MENKDDKKWEVLDSEYLFHEPWLTARRDHIRQPSGVEMENYYVLEYPEWVNIIAITRDGHFLMERQYRHACGITAIEIPAGCAEPGETPMEAAKRELMEETGYSGGEWSLFMDVCPNPGSFTNTSWTFLAVGVEPTDKPHLEETEDIDIFLMTEEEVRRKLENNEFRQALMVAPLWKYFALKDRKK